jgi:hypothetical protein
VTHDVLCSSCSDVAMRVDDEEMSCVETWTLQWHCLGCSKLGQLEQVDDGEQAMLVFRTEAEQ